MDITNTALSHRETTNPVIERVHRMRDLVLEATKLRDLVSFTYLHNMLKCSERGNVLLKTEGLKRPNFIAMETLPEILLGGAYESMEVRKMACPWYPSYTLGY